MNFLMKILPVQTGHKKPRRCFLPLRHETDSLTNRPLLRFLVILDDCNVYSKLLESSFLDEHGLQKLQMFFFLCFNFAK